MHVSAAELVRVDAHAGELGHHRRPAHERVGVGRHHDEVRQPQQQGRTGHRWPRDDEDDGHDARAIGEGPGGQAPAVQCGHALDDVGAARRDVPDERDPLGERGLRGDGDRLTVDRAERSPPVGGVDGDDDSSASVDVIDAGADTSLRAPPDRDTHGAEVTSESHRGGRREREMQAGLLRGLRAHDPAHELGDALRLRAQRATTPSGEADVTPMKPANGMRFHAPVSQPGTAVAGSTAAPNPWNASDAASRTPSSSACA